MNISLRTLGAALGFFTLFTAFADQATQAQDKCAPKPAIVLVHGAFADASGFQYLIPLLQDAGYEVTGAQIPLTSLEDDVAAAQRVLDLQTSDVVLVGHSYGGAVISGAGNHPSVKALVYIAAFAPDDNEVTGALIASQPPSDLDSALVPDAAGFLYIDRAAYHDVFAGDVAPELTRVLAVTQRPVSQVTFTQSIPHAAWHDLPTWYAVAKHDHTINPDLERFMAQRMGAETIELDTSHVPFISQPALVSELIVKAARAVQHR
ncbi:MAG: alpha/beta hydrolase [Polyangiales bacterium]